MLNGWRRKESIIKAFFMAFFLCPQALFSPLTTTKVTKREKEKLQTKHVHSSICQSFLSWRKRMLIVATTLLSLSTIPMLVNLRHKDYVGDAYYYGFSCDNCTTLGITAQISQDIAPASIFIGAIVGIFVWTDFRLSKRTLVYGWILAIILGFWPFLLPVSYLRNNINRGIQGIAEDYTNRIQSGFLNTVSSLPMFLAISGNHFSLSHSTCT